MEWGVLRSQNFKKYTHTRGIAWTLFFEQCTRERGGGEGLESLPKLYRQKSAKSHTVTIICVKLRLRESRKDLKIMKIKPFFSHGAFRYDANDLLNDFQDI